MKLKMFSDPQSVIIRAGRSEQNPSGIGAPSAPSLLQKDAFLEESGGTTGEQSKFHGALPPFVDNGINSAKGAFP